MVHDLPTLGTHQLASMAVVSVTFGVLFPCSLMAVVAVLLTAWLADWAIDHFEDTTAHTHDGDTDSSRSAVTHSVLTAPIVGLVVGLLTAYLLISLRAAAGALFQTDFFDVFVNAVGGGAWFLNFLNFNMAMALAGVMTGVLHLFLDSFTEDGIYVPFKRWWIASVDARDTSLNVTLDSHSPIRSVWSIVASATAQPVKRARWRKSSGDSKPFSHPT